MMLDVLNENISNGSNNTANLSLKRKLNDDDNCKGKYDHDNSLAPVSDSYNDIIDILVHVCDIKKIETAYKIFHNNKNNDKKKKIDRKIFNGNKIIHILECVNKILEAMEFLDLKDSALLVPLMDGKDEYMCI